MDMGFFDNFNFYIYIIFVFLPLIGFFFFLSGDVQERVQQFTTTTKTFRHKTKVPNYRLDRLRESLSPTKLPLRKTQVVSRSRERTSNYSTCLNNTSLLYKTLVGCITLCQSVNKYLSGLMNTLFFSYLFHSLRRFHFSMENGVDYSS